jgi:hypothetical protein
VSDPRKDGCGSCFYVGEADDGEVRQHPSRRKSVNVETGKLVCLRNPPVAVAIMLPGGQLDRVAGIVPPVSKDSWCGEWRAALVPR